ncbi:hypothetical protein BRC81_16555 [Halobacteriales archaeon QS_1_68_20]|nr:MAG: hypothetical protein BRC81_16555 [Halobacteriales archaeon QS_1_68_20]
MPDPSTLRDSTQIVLAASELDGLREQLESEFTVTVFPLEHDGEEEYVRIIGSPVVIQEVAQFLTRNGVDLP